MRGRSCGMYPVLAGMLCSPLPVSGTKVAGICLRAFREGSVYDVAPILRAPRTPQLVPPQFRGAHCVAVRAIRAMRGGNRRER